MTCKPWGKIGTGMVVRVACAVLVLGGMVGVAQAQTSGQKYARIMERIDTLQSNNDILKELVNSQEQKLAHISNRIEGLDGAEKEIKPLLHKMYQQLVEFVASDLPFKLEKRQQYLDKIGQIMDKKGSYALKFRRLLRAYQIEIQYGRKMVAYDGKLPDGRSAEFVHVGRVALMYRTEDGEEVGYWNENKDKWVAAPQYIRKISTAIAIANEKVAPKLIVVPVPAPKEAHS